MNLMLGRWIGDELDTRESGVSRKQEELHRQKTTIMQANSLEATEALRAEVGGMSDLLPHKWVDGGVGNDQINDAVTKEDDDNQEDFDALYEQKISLLDTMQMRKQDYDQSKQELKTLMEKYKEKEEEQGGNDSDECNTLLPSIQVSK